MSHSMKFLLPSLVAILLAVPAPVSACAAIGPDGSRIEITAEAALIVWDEANKTEHFIRRASFESTAYDFGFLVPTPTLPEIAESDDDVFTRLADITKPKVEYRTQTASIGCGMGAKFSSSEVAGKADGVMVLQAGRVGDHDVVSLKFDPKAGTVEAGSRALADWLVRFGYGFGTTLKEWVQPYVKNGWVITAFRIAGQRPEEPAPRATGRDRSGSHGLRAKPVRLSFKTDRPFYPYREPADARDASQKNSPRMLKVYFVADQRYSGTLGDSGQFPGRTVWSDMLRDAERTDVIAKAKLPGNAGPKEWRLTEFEDRSSPRPGTDEVYFRVAENQEIVARPRIIYYRDSFTAWFIGLAVCFGLPAATFLLLAVKRRAAA
jgi:hypothetical protein